MRANSLALRLFLSATAWTVVILFVTGVVLSSFYRHAVERSFDRRLGVYLKTLVADIASPEAEGAEKFPQSLGEPLFELPLSGWYWQITRLDPQKPDVQSSRSLWDSSLPRLPQRDSSDPDASRVGYARGPEDQRLRIFERTIDLGDEGRYLLSVAGNAEEIDEEMRSFDEALALTFGVLGVVLLLTTMFQVRFGLAPLQRISKELAAIRSGTAEKLEGSFPEEIAPLARETNALIDANREIVQRARTHVGNLAHALKTPISVIMNEAASRDDPFAAKVREQTAIMRDQVTRHLERARLVAHSKSIGTVTEIAPVVVSLARTMEKIHHARAIAIDIDSADGVRFRGERQDLEEMVGNLVDNACKWAKSRVSIEAVPVAARDAGKEPQVRVVVDDDGPGLSPEERDEVQAPKRGRRLDETKPGSGLGLSIVVELANLYGGGLSFGIAPIGGLRAELSLPAA
jgi:signal transduction histidine kinase